jgi:hypothetical protein
MGGVRTLLAFAACLVVAVSCGSSSGSGMAADGGGAGTGTSAGTGGLASGAAGASGGGHSTGGSNATGGHSAGGASAVGGTAGGSACGPCPGIACAEAVQLTIAPDPSAGGAIISNLKIDSPGLDLQCRTNGGSPCQWFCQSVSYQIADGDYTVTISAPGYAPATLDIHAVSPTNCGCCGCCPFNYFKSVTLTPNGASPAGCCANLDSDSTNCGTCGHACPNSGPCVAGKCGPSFGECLIEGGGFATCDAYCASLKQTCSAACGPSLNQASVEWTGNSGCSDLSGAETVGSCSSTLETVPSGNAVPASDCCCGDP